MGDEFRDKSRKVETGGGPYYERFIQIVRGSRELQILLVLVTIALVLIAVLGGPVAIESIANLVASSTPVPSKTPPPSPTSTPSPTPLPFAPATDDEILILVADFELAAEGVTNPTPAIVEALDGVQDVIGSSKVRIERVHENITDRADAQNWGKLTSATMVIWGMSSPGGVTVHYEKIRNQEHVQTCIDRSSTSQTDVDNFEVYLFEGMDTTYITNFTIGQIYYSQGNYEDAIPFFNLAIAAAPAGRETELSVGLAYFYRGTAYGILDKYAEAIEDYGKAERFNSDYILIYDNRGLFYFNLGEYDKSVVDFTRSLELDPSCAATYAMRGFTYIKRGEYDLAVADYTRAIELVPSRETIHVFCDEREYSCVIGLERGAAESGRGYAYQLMGLNEQAIADYTRAIELDFDPLSWVYGRRGETYQSLGEYDLAVADYSRAIELDPDDAIPYNGRGDAYYNAGDYEHAVGDFTSALGIDPKFARAYNNRANAYRELGEHENALADYAKALELEDIDAYFNRGVLYYYNLGEPQQALADFEAYVALSDNDVFIGRARTLIDEIRSKLADSPTPTH